MVIGAGIRGALIAERLTEDGLDVEGLREEASARRHAGFEVSFLTRGQVRDAYGIKGRAALLGHGGMAADPRKLASGFLRAALVRGARLYAPVEATGIDPLVSGAVVHTAAGLSLRATAVVFATGYEMPKGVPRMGHRVTSTWALATRPQLRAAWRDEVTISEASDPYLYLRVAPQGRILCGGEDEAFIDQETRDALIPRKIAALQEKLVRLLPQVRPSRRGKERYFSQRDGNGRTSSKWHEPAQPSRPAARLQSPDTKETSMGRSILLWMLGIPIPIIILLALFWR